MEDAQASFQILRLSAASRLSHLLRTVPPPITHQAALTTDYDALVECTLASIIAGDGAAAAGLPTPEEVAHDPTVYQNQAYLGHEALRQAHLFVREGGLRLTSSNSIKGISYTCCNALVLLIGRVVWRGWLRRSCPHEGARHQMGRAQVGNILQRVPAFRGRNRNSTSSAAILFCFTAGRFIPHAPSSLQAGSSACGNPTAPFARPGVCARALYRGGNQIRWTRRSAEWKRGRGRERGGER